MNHATLIAEKSGEAVKAGPIGLAVILILCIACYFLFKSMSRHMKNVRENFPVDPEPAVSTTKSGKPVRPATPVRPTARVTSTATTPTSTPARAGEPDADTSPSASAESDST